MIEVLGISGSPVKEGNTEVFLHEALDPLAGDPEVRLSILNLSRLEIAGCAHCNWCLKSQTSDQFCAISDGMDGIYPAIACADVVILATPVHIMRISGLMATMIDRLRVFVYGNVHRGKLKDKVGGALIVAFLRHGGLESTLNILNNTFALFRMIPVGQGGLALTSLHGQGKINKGVRHMVLEDAFGLYSAKEMVQRAVEIARIMQAGKKALQMR
ncbi:MAG TPA: flavodoxin family protein [Thermodesulfobacteriota bacterium]|nr:flavodoxin family protein [Thermodesulfobacteriota bacterium]